MSAITTYWVESVIAARLFSLKSFQPLNRSLSHLVFRVSPDSWYEKSVLPCDQVIFAWIAGRHAPTQAVKTSLSSYFNCEPGRIKPLPLGTSQTDIESGSYLS